LNYTSKRKIGKEILKMSGEKERGLSKINIWINGELYKAIRKLCIDKEIPFKEAIERGIKLVLEENSYQKGE
jgi:hypothetical protein